MKPDRFAMRCDVVPAVGELITRMMRHCMAVLERVLEANRTLHGLSWAIESDGVDSEGTGASLSEVIRAVRQVRSNRTLYAMIEGRCDATQEWWTEIAVTPVANRLGGYEVFIQVVFQGILLDKPAAKPYEQLFTEALTEFLTMEDGCTQAFLSDDLEPGELPLE